MHRFFMALATSALAVQPTLAGVAIQALGTQFNVYRRPEGTTVVVLEGKVRISSGQPLPEGGERKAPTGIEPAQSSATPFTAGEKAYIDTHGIISRGRTVDPGSTVAWQQRRLVFQTAPLSEITREFNRYNTAPKFRLDGAAVEARHYTGMFDADDPESLLELLMAEPGLAVTRIGDDILVSVPGDTLEVAPSDSHWRRYVREHRHGLTSLDYTDDALQGSEEIFTRCGQLQIQRTRRHWGFS